MCHLNKMFFLKIRLKHLKQIITYRFHKAFLEHENKLFNSIFFISGKALDKRLDPREERAWLKFPM